MSRFNNFLASGHTFREMDSYLAFRIRVLNYFMGVGVLFSFLIGALGNLEIMKIGQLQANADHIYGVFNLFLIWLLRQDIKKFKLVAWLQVSASFVLFFIALVSVVNDELRAIWFYVAVYLAYMLLGIRVGFVFTVAGLLAIVLANYYFDLQISGTAIGTAIFTMIVFGLLNRTYHIQMVSYENQLKQKNVELEKNINELDSALEEARELSRAKSMFLANMSHEIRTPMNGVLSMVQVLETTKLDEQQKNYLSSVEQSGKRLLALIDDLLDLSKIESGKVDIKHEVFKVWDFVEDILVEVEPLFDDGSVEFITEIDNQLPEFLVGDEYRLKQVVTNLVNNAAKFTREGKVTLLITEKQLTSTDCRLYIEVRDTGIGINKQNIAGIFEAFHQLSADRIANKGVGLGLAICKRLVDFMEGTINVESSPGKGTAFSLEITLPIGKAPESKLLDNKDEISGSNRTILIVDDDPISQLAVKTYFVNKGFNVLLAENGNRALYQIEERDVDVILMDVHMPVMDGVTATRAIKSNKLTNAPVIGMTASVMNDERKGYFDAGMDDLVEKPVNFEYLLKVINEQLAKLNRV